MSALSIQFDHVFKKFRRGERFDSIRDLIPGSIRGLRRRQNKTDLIDEREFWALHDVSFSVKKGTALGIIGPNGAGKSTILKILSRIIRPTRGVYCVTGRLSALIEVGAGFHQDLTGRENIYLNGAILGMNRGEITERFDEIVEFSGIRGFIETPVKRYSSGMYARLGFSVAVHLRPDVLLVDEVLSVGDMAFQAKCQRKMHEIAQSGTTIVFITHNMNAVADLCLQTLVLREGRVAFHGQTHDAINFYHQLASTNMAADDSFKNLQLVDKKVTDAEGENCTMYNSGDPFALRLTFRALKDLRQLTIGVWLRNVAGEQLFNISSQRLNVLPFSLAPNEEVSCEFHFVANLCAGSYSIGVVVRRNDLDMTYYEREPIERIEIADATNCGGSAWLSPECNITLSKSQ